MASPRLRVLPASTGKATGQSPAAGAVVVASPPGANGGTPALGDEAIWMRLRDAGFDEETVKRRDKAALIAYISKLESEMYDYQHHMGLLILERKEWTSKYEQLKASAESAKTEYKREQASHLSALAEAQKQEKNLKNALGVEKECVANIEKALHDMRAESAETKLAYERKLAETRLMMETAQRKFDEAERKLIEAESLHAEATRSRNASLRALQEAEAREDELRRRLISFKSECDTKENEINLQRQSLYDSQKILHQEQERLLEGQTLLNRREEYILGRSKKLSCFEKELEEARLSLDEERRALKEEKSELDLKMAALATREEAVIKRESLLDKRERELLILQEKVASKEHDDIRQLAVEHQSALERKRIEFEAELEQRSILFEDEMEAKRLAFEAREADLKERENALQERDNGVKLQLSDLAENQEDVTKKLKLLEENEQNLLSTQRAAEVEMQNMHKEKEEILLMKADLEKTRASVEDEKKEILLAQEKLELTVSERNELLVLETKLKEEIDSFRAQKMEFVAEAERLKAEKEKFEVEWELIDEKREVLQREAERIAEERKAVEQFLKNEHDSIKLEKENLRNQFKSDIESLSREREEFINKMDREHADWFSKIQREREDFVKDIKIQRKELENCIDKRREEIENYLRAREEAFEQEKTKELQHINHQKEMIAKELEYVASELQKLNNERMEIALDREQREKEWSEVKSSIELLNIQREKLQKQRELLHVDREEIHQQIERLKKLEDQSIESENRALSEVPLKKWKIPLRKDMKANVLPEEIDGQTELKDSADGGSMPMKSLPGKNSDASSPISTTLAFIKHCGETMLRRSPTQIAYANHEKVLDGKISAKMGEAMVVKEISSPKPHSRTTDSGANSLLMGRKRLSNSLSRDQTDMRLEPSKKHQKKTRSKESSDFGGITSKGLREKQMPWSGDESDRARLNQNVGCDKMPVLSKDQEHGDFKASNSKIPAIPESAAAGLCSDILEYDKSNGQGNLSQIGNNTKLSTSRFTDTSKTQEVFLEAVEPSKKITLTATELIADNGDKYEEQDEYSQDSGDEIDVEDKDEVSVKQRIWKFLIT